MTASNWKYQKKNIETGQITDLTISGGYIAQDYNLREERYMSSDSYAFPNSSMDYVSVKNGSICHQTTIPGDLHATPFKWWFFTLEQDTITVNGQDVTSNVIVKEVNKC